MDWLQKQNSHTTSLELTFDKRNQLYVLDDKRIRKIAVDGSTLPYWIYRMRAAVSMDSPQKINVASSTTWR